MASIDEATIIKALAGVRDDQNGGDLVSLGMVSGLVLKDGHVAFAIEVDPARGEKAEPLRAAAERTVFALPGVLSVTAVLTAQTKGKGAPKGPPPTMPRAARRTDTPTRMARAMGTITVPPSGRMAACRPRASAAPRICVRKSR